ncbi:MAG: hypothetical protein PVG78_00535 [Desulfobacterales bacterium]|jgi:hypothetical protein
MVSDDFRFRQFAKIAAGKEYHEIIYLAEQEALQAWRMAHPSKGLTEAERSRCLEYQQKLLGLIAYLRHGLVPKDSDGRIGTLYRSIRSEALVNNQVAV